MQKISTCLWFHGNAEEAVTFYVSVFKDSRILQTSRYGEGGPYPKGTALALTFELEGVKFMALNGGVDFPFTVAMSLFVSCETQAEVDTLWEKLTEGGGAPGRCGWLKDRFGASWQIIPSAMGKLMSDPDPVKSQRVMKAMLGMNKIDLRLLEQAQRGE